MRTNILVDKCIYIPSWINGDERAYKNSFNCPAIHKTTLLPQVTSNTWIGFKREWSFWIARRTRWNLIVYLSLYNKQGYSCTSPFGNFVNLRERQCYSCVEFYKRTRYNAPLLYIFLDHELNKTPGAACNYIFVYEDNLLNCLWTQTSLSKKKRYIMNCKTKLRCMHASFIKMCLIFPQSFHAFFQTTAELLNLWYITSNGFTYHCGLTRLVNSK